MHPDSQPTLKIKLERLNFSHGLADHVFCRLPSIKELIEEYSHRDVQLIDGVLNAPRIRDAHRRALEEGVRLEYAEPNEKLLEGCRPLFAPEDADHPPGATPVPESELLEAVRELPDDALSVTRT